MSSNPPQKAQSQPPVQVEKALREMLEVQKGEQDIRRQEIKLEQEKIKSNERLALASIDAQKDDRKQQMVLFAGVHKTKYITIGGIAILITLVLGIAMWLNKVEIAMEILKIGGTGILAYIAGVSKGKNIAIEKRNHQDEE